MCVLTQGCMANKQLHFPDSGDMPQTRLSASLHPSCFGLHSDVAESRMITYRKGAQLTEVSPLFW